MILLFQLGINIEVKYFKSQIIEINVTTHLFRPEWYNISIVSCDGINYAHSFQTFAVLSSLK